MKQHSRFADEKERKRRRNPNCKTNGVELAINALLLSLNKRRRLASSESSWFYLKSGCGKAGHFINGSALGKEAVQKFSMTAVFLVVVLLPHGEIRRYVIVTNPL